MEMFLANSIYNVVHPLKNIRSNSLIALYKGVNGKSSQENIIETIDIREKRNSKLKSKKKKKNKEEKKRNDIVNNQSIMTFNGKKSLPKNPYYNEYNDIVDFNINNTNSGFKYFDKEILHNKDNNIKMSNSKISVFKNTFNDKIMDNDLKTSNLLLYKNSIKSTASNITLNSDIPQLYSIDDFKKNKINNDIYNSELVRKNNKDMINRYSQPSSFLISNDNVTGNITSCSRFYRLTKNKKNLVK